MIPPDDVKTVSELTSEIRGLLEDTFETVWVRGEVSKLSRPTSGHVYFTLKDENSVISCVIWKSAVSRLKFDLKDGTEVFGRGSITLYPPRGSYQISFDFLQPVGVGSLEQQLQERKEELFRLGYFEPERKKPLPKFPRRVALVTSPTGAVIRDMLEVLNVRMPAVEVIVVPVKVQGPGAAEQVAGAIERLNDLNESGELPISVAVVGRGGGSLEDLWAFNERVVADAIFRSQIPIVTAIGHETDVTIADLVADRRAVTPTEAATLIVPESAQYRAGVQQTEVRLNRLMRQRIDWGRERLESIRSRRAFRSPLDGIRDLERRLDEVSDRLSGCRQRFVREVQKRMGELSARLHRAAGRQIETAKQRMAGSAQMLQAVSPLAVLGRGYSLTTADGAVVHDAATLKVGDRVRSRLHRGSIVARVEEVNAGVADG